MRSKRVPRNRSKTTPGSGAKACLQD